MPEALTKSEVERGQDPSVNKQWDDQASLQEKYKDFEAIADKLGVCIMGTFRPGIGPLGRSMAVAKRTGPDFLFLANGNSQKFDDIKANPQMALSFQNSSNQDWISVTGEVVKTSSDDPRIKELFNKATAAWFGDLGDGVHDGTANDPRVTLIEVHAKYVSYWKHTVLGGVGFVAEVASAAVTGKVAQTGVLRQLKDNEIQQLRAKESSMSA